MMLDAMGNPVMSEADQQQMQAQARVQGMFFTCYFQLVPIVAARMLEEEARSSGFLPEDGEDLPPIADRIAEQAEEIAIAAMRRVGFNIQKGRG